MMKFAANLFMMGFALMITGICMLVVLLTIVFL